MAKAKKPAERSSTAWRHGAVAVWMMCGMGTSGTLHLLGYGDAAAMILLAVSGLAFIPVLADLARQLLKSNFSVDVLAALSIGSALLFRQYWVAAIVILMLAGGKALEDYATQRASSILGALARRMPQVAHRVGPQGEQSNISLDQVAVGDALALHPHELCPVDGAVISGNSQMDESYLTGEPFLVAKAPGAMVLSGTINGDSCLMIRATRIAAESRYAKIVQVLKDSELSRPRMRRIADRLAAWYTPLAIAIAVFAWLGAGDPERFLAVLVIATPCPLLLAVPIAIIGAISVAARRGIIIKDPSVLEKIGSCGILISDKTGTLTYGKPELEEIVRMGRHNSTEILRLAASIEQYSKHPLSTAVLAAARSEHIDLRTAGDVFETPGEGVTGHTDGHLVTLTGRNHLARHMQRTLPEVGPGLESVILVDGELAGLLKFHDEPRIDSKHFLGHVRSHHGIGRVVLLSGDRTAAVDAFAKIMEIAETHGGKSPEEKLAIVRDLTAQQNTIYIGDGINDAPAMMSATVGIAMGTNSDVTSEAAGAVILQSSLASVDELIHIAARSRNIALTSAIGGMSLSAIGIAASALGFLKPIEGAILQEGIDLLSILYALRVVLPTKSVGDLKVPEKTHRAAQTHILPGISGM